MKLLLVFIIIESVLLLGSNDLSVFLNAYPDLVHSVMPCVMTVADHCYSIGLISRYTFKQLCVREDLLDEDRARMLLDDIREVLSSRLSALKEFVTVLSQVDYCRQVADKIQRQLQ